jgi:hypothetical protein
MGHYGNALGPGHNECKILEATRRGHSYSLRLSCMDLPDESTRTQRAIITVLADDRIAIRWASRTAIPPKCGGAARTFKSFGRMNSKGAGGYENRSCIAAVGDRETELVLFDERLRKRR